MKCKYFFAFALIFLSLCLSNIADTKALQQNTGRLIYLTLIPNYKNNTVQFDGKSELDAATDPLDVAGLSLDVERSWVDNATWNIMGTIVGAKISYDQEKHVYHMLIGPISLQPFDELKLVFPFVNLDNSQIQPRPDVPDQGDENSPQRNHHFSYSAGVAGRELNLIDIPFTPVTKNIDLVLTPLIGEALIGKADGFRLSGQVQFAALKDFAEFSYYCQNTTNRLKHGDYRIAHLLYTLDYPHYFGPDVLNSAYQFKPTTIALRSELMECQYDPENEIGRVEAVFSGRVFGFSKSEDFFPAELQGSDPPDGNYPYVPLLPFKGVNGYEIRLGKIMLEPGDTLTITVPNTQIQTDSLNPSPDSLVSPNSGQTLIVYRGPLLFDLSLPYVPQTQLYISQMPAILRPSIGLVEAQFGRFFPVSESLLTWIIFGVSFLLLILYRLVQGGRWLLSFFSFLMGVSFFYGVRGSFGLLCIALALKISQAISSNPSPKSIKDFLRIMSLGLVNLVLIVFAVYFDGKGTRVFRGLSTPDLSPLTPLVLLILVGGMFLLLYGRPQDANVFQYSDLPTLVLFLAALCLYDAFDKSLLALIVLCMGCLYVTDRAFRNRGSVSRQKNFGKDLQTRLKLVFRNRLIPLSILVLIVFAIGNDLSSTYANELNITLSWLAAPMIIPLLIFVSIFLTFTSIALLFILVYPILPFNAGYAKAIVFALFLFLVFLFGIGTDDRLIAALPAILVGRVIYYFSVPMLIGIYFDIQELMRKENKRRSTLGKGEKGISFQSAGSMYFKKLQGLIGTLAGILSLVAPSIYAFLSSQSVIVTYFSLLEKLVLLPI